jgi:hypothetical protein
MSTVTVLKQYVAPCTYSYLQRCPSTNKLVVHTKTYNQRVAILQQDTNVVIIEDFQSSQFRSQKALQSLFPIALHYAKMGTSGYKHLTTQYA